MKDKNYELIYIKQNKLSNYDLENTAILKSLIDELEEEMDELSESIKNAANKLNLYINNIKDISINFDCSIHSVFFEENKNVMKIYLSKTIEKIIKKLMKEKDMDIFEVYDILMDNLPKAKCEVNLTNKQLNTCVKYSYLYNDLSLEYEELLFDYSDNTKVYNKAINDIKQYLSENKNNHNFDEELWQFAYIQKENLQNFLKQIENEE